MSAYMEAILGVALMTSAIAISRICFRVLRRRRNADNIEGYTSRTDGIPGMHLNMADYSPSSHPAQFLVFSAMLFIFGALLTANIVFGFGWNK